MSLFLSLFLSSKQEIFGSGQFYNAAIRRFMKTLKKTFPYRSESVAITSFQCYSIKIWMLKLILNKAPYYIIKSWQNYCYTSLENGHEQLKSD